MNFFFEVVLYLHVSTIQPYLEYCYLDMLDKLQKRISRAAGPSLAASLDPLVHRPNATSLSIFYRYYFGRCSSGLVSLSYS